MTSHRKQFFYLTVFLVAIPAVWAAKPVLKSQTLSASMAFGGLTRTYRYYLPGRVTGAPSKVPLVLILHGGSGNAQSMEKLTFQRFNELADQEGFIALYPDGVGRNWNDGREVPASRAHREKIDDVGFLSALIDRFVKEYGVDPLRVYVTGISNGAMMSLRLACELSDKIVAVAPVAGSMPKNGLEACKPRFPVSVLFINGTEDPLVPYQGGWVHFLRQKRGEVFSVPESAKLWAWIDGCKGRPVTESLPRLDSKDPTSVQRIYWPIGNNKAEIVLYVIRGDGHTWPKGWKYAGEWLVGKVSRNLDASDVIWEFFKHHKR